MFVQQLILAKMLKNLGAALRFRGSIPLVWWKHIDFFFEVFLLIFFVPDGDPTRHKSGRTPGTCCQPASVRVSRRMLLLSSTKQVSSCVVLRKTQFVFYDSAQNIVCSTRFCTKPGLYSLALHKTCLVFCGSAQNIDRLLWFCTKHGLYSMVLRRATLHSVILLKTLSVFFGSAQRILFVLSACARHGL